MNKLLKTTSIVGMAYLGIVLVLYFSQDSLMYAPSTLRILPQEVGLSDVQEITLVGSAGTRLYSWYGKAATDMPTFLFFHGNGGSVAGRTHKFTALMAAGYGIFMLGYPGYGGSDGTPSEPAFIEASALAWDWLLSHGVSAERIVIYGESLGTAVAVQLAASKPAQAVILEAPMSSVREIAAWLYPWLPVRWLLQDHFMSINYVGAVQTPLLVFHGTADQVIPLASGRRLFEAANEPKQFHAIDGASHNDLYAYPVVELMQQFLQVINDGQLPN